MLHKPSLFISFYLFPNFDSENLSSFFLPFDFDFDSEGIKVEETACVAFSSMLAHNVVMNKHGGTHWHQQMALEVRSLSLHCFVVFVQIPLPSLDLVRSRWY